jgi:hypothetical protein
MADEVFGVGRGDGQAGDVVFGQAGLGEDDGRAVVGGELVAEAGVDGAAVGGGGVGVGGGWSRGYARV